MLQNIEWIGVILLSVFVVVFIIGVIMALATSYLTGLRQWLYDHNVFSGLLGNIITSTVALIIAGGIYAELRTVYERAEICTNELGEIFTSLGERKGGDPILVYIRDGIGKAKEGVPLFTKYIRMNQTSQGSSLERNQWCAKVKYAQNFGFQFKIFVPFRMPDEEQKKGFSEQHVYINEKLNELQEEFLKSWPSPPLGSFAPDNGQYVTADRGFPEGLWRIWILLKHYPYAQENLEVAQGPVYGNTPIIWNNIYLPSNSLCVKSFLGWCLEKWNNG